jgi:hypothetical protein
MRNTICFMITVASGLGLAALAAGAVPGNADFAEKDAIDYFGARPPGNAAELFAPGIVSRADRFEARIAFSADGQECYLTETDATFSRPKLLCARRHAGAWPEFTPVSFASRFNVCHEPFLSAGDRKLYFTADGDETVPTNRRDLWVAERVAGSWGDPVRLAAPLNSDWGEFFFGESANGVMVFASNRPGGLGDFDLYHTEKTADGETRAVNFGPVLNTPGPEYDPCLAQDGRMLVFAGAREGRPNLDLYVTIREGANGWSAPVPLSGGVNTDANEYAPVFSPDGRYLFFVRHDGRQSDLFWMATTALERRR